MNYLDACTFVHLRISVWSGKTRLLGQDLTLGKGGKLPSGKAVRLGEKCIINPQKISTVEYYRNAARKCCRQYGTDFLGGYAVANDHLDGIVEKLDNLKCTFENVIVPEFLSEFPKEAEEWVKSEFDKPVTIPDVSDIKNKFSFKYTVYTVEGKHLPDEKEFGDSVLDGVAADVKQLWQKSISGKQKISQKFLNQSLNEVYQKLKMLAFGDSRILQVVSAMEQLKTQLPKTGGVLQGTPQYLLLTNILLSLMEPDRLEEILQSGSASAIWSIPTQQPVISIPTSAVESEQVVEEAAIQDSVEPEQPATTGTFGWF